MTLQCNHWRHAAGSWAAVVLLACATNALAHKGSDAYLDIQPVPPASGSAAAASADTHRFVLSVALRDLDQLMPVDGNGDAQITWAEVKAATPRILQWLGQTVRLDEAHAPPSGNTVSACVLHWQADGLDRRGDGTYLRTAATATCPWAQALDVRYTLFREQDATHRLLVSGRIGNTELLTTASPQQGDAVRLRAAKTGAAGTETPDAQPAGSNRINVLRDYFVLGMHHLLAGYDHLAFLLALVLPLRLSLRRPRVGGDLQAMPGDGPRWVALLTTITAFTIGHSITLILATLGWTQASPSWVEPVIALSVGVTAALNLRPIPRLRTELLALVFGMVHGYGFAGLMQEAAAPGGLLPWALAGFNLGVEAGQLFAVAVWVVLSQLVVDRAWYRPVVVRGGSLLLIGLAAWWFWQRVV
jgi:hypothetical protein